MPHTRPAPLLHSDTTPSLLSAQALLDSDLPERDAILAPLLATRTLNLLYGPRGLGKTFVAMGIAYAAASGTSFLGWQAPCRNRVVYVDGEMASIDIKRRLASFGPAPDTLEFIVSDSAPRNRLPDLAEWAGQEALYKAFGASLPDLVILDNLASLAGYHRGDPDPWTRLERYLLMLRRLGIAVLVIHNTNKAGDQRGSSRREDMLDLVLALRRPADHASSDGVRFEMHVEKARGLAGAALDPIEARMAFDAGGRVAWTWGPAAKQEIDRFADLLRDGLNPNQIARELGIPTSRAYRLRDQLEATTFSPAVPSEGDPA